MLTKNNLSNLLNSEIIKNSYLNHSIILFLFPLNLEIEKNLLTYIKEILSPEEITFSKQFKFNDLTRNYILSKGLQKIIISFFVENTTPNHIKFQKNQFGKPFLCNNQYPSAPYFSVSHTKYFLLIAICKYYEIGVDIEYIKQNLELNLKDIILSQNEKKNFQQSIMIKKN